jgi:hypothetical protein
MTVGSLLEISFEKQTACPSFAKGLFVENVCSSVLFMYLYCTSSCLLDEGEEGQAEFYFDCTVHTSSLYSTYLLHAFSMMDEFAAVQSGGTSTVGRQGVKRVAKGQNINCRGLFITCSVVEIDPKSRKPDFLTPHSRHIMT